MQYLAIFLIAYGAFLLLALIMQFPFIFNNMKSKAMIKMMGKKGFQLMLFVLAAVFIAVGIIILP